MKGYIWVGHREAELFKTNHFFCGSVTTWGNNENGNISYCKKYRTREVDNVTRNRFFAAELEKLLENNEYKIMFYSSSLAYGLMKINPKLEKNFICINSKPMLSLLNNKITTRVWMSNHLPVIKFVLLSGRDCNYKQIKEFFPNYNSFIIQESNSSGGLGTFLINKDNSPYVIEGLKEDELYLASYYASPSFSINTHILITDNNIIVFPSSVQIIEEYGYNLIYSGADFVNFKYVENEVQKKIYNYSKKIGTLLKGIGYKGICGIDYLIYGKEVYFIEINPRFQASSILLNAALDEAGLPCLQMLHCNAFEKKIFACN